MRKTDTSAATRGPLDWAFVIGSLVAIVGVLIGMGLHASVAEECASDRSDPACRTQLFLMATAFALGALTALFGVLRLRELNAAHADFMGWVELLFSLVPGGVIVGLALWYTSGPTEPGETPFGSVIAVVATVLAMPMVLVVDAVRQIATKRRRHELAEPPSVSDALSLRRHLQGALTMLGAYLAVSILTVGAFHTLDVAASDEPGTAVSTTVGDESDGGLGVVLFGAFYTTLVGAYYLPAHAALDRLSQAVQDRDQPLPATNDDGLHTKLAPRDALGGLLKLGEQPLENLKRALLIFSPLLSSLLTLRFPD